MDQVLRFHGLFDCGRVVCDVDIDMVGYHIVYLEIYEVSSFAIMK